MSREQTKGSVLAENAAELAGALFDRGFSCTRSVLQATTGTSHPELLAAASGFSCGIGNSGCLCGAAAGGVMALGLKGCAEQSGELMVAFKKTFKATCCRGLSKSYHWMGEEHLANCRKITVATVGMVEKIQKNQQ